MRQAIFKDIPSGAWVIVRLLWLDPGRELETGDASRLKLPRTSLGGPMPPTAASVPSTPLLLLAIELPLLRPGPACVLHLLLTLSERLSIALWTNPPRPLVGETGLSTRSREMRPCEGDIARARTLGLDSADCVVFVSDEGVSKR